MDKSIVITGLGVLACNGIGRQAFWKSLCEGRSGIRAISRFDPSEFPCHIGGELWDFQPEDFMKKTTVLNWHRHVHLALATSKMAVAESELASAGYAPERIASGIGTSIGSPNELYIDQHKIHESRGYKRVSRYASSAFSGHSGTIHVSIDLGFAGPAVTIASGCATGIDTLAWGMSQIRSGAADAVLVGATESPLFPLSFATACSLGILSKRNDEPEKAMRPFDRNRDGIVLSEGAVAVVMERSDYAKSRGAPIMAELCSTGAAADASNPLVLDVEGKALARAIKSALKNAGATAADVDHVQSHGVSLEMYDRTETNGLKLALGDRAYRVPISGIKSMTGQAYAAGGLMGAAGALMALSEGIVAPTINLEDPDPECDLDYVPQQARMNDVNGALAVAISFGGTYATAYFRRLN